MIGRVVSTKMNNTVTVLIERVAKHALYKKTFVRSKKYLVATDGEVSDGDMVEIVKVRPISKNKHWKVVKIVGKNLAEINEAKLKVEAEKVIAEIMPEVKEKKTEQVEVKVKEERKVKKEKK
jgi:small subunit ribosomal protein S17